MAQPESAALQTAGASRRRGLVRLAAALCAMAAVGLGGCASMSEKLVEPMSHMPGIGMRAEVPERPAEAKPYPAVHEMPPPRTTVLMDGAEQQRMERELVTARDTQKTYTTAQPEAPPPPPVAAASRKKPAPQRTQAPIPNVVPASSSRTIY